MSARLLADLLDRQGVRLQPEALDELYLHLRRIARRARARQASQATLCTTELVHEAWLKLSRTGAQDRFRDLAHFYATSAMAIRHLLIDHLRERGRRVPQEPIDERAAIADPRTDGADGLLALDAALDALAQQYPRPARVVELRFFGGFEVEDIAGIVGVAARTVHRDWRFAQAWLRRRLDGETAAGDGG
jgi:RNA polymerase sigma factor (TIGR02999 family)